MNRRRTRNLAGALSLLLAVGVVSVLLLADSDERPPAASIATNTRQASALGGTVDYPPDLIELGKQSALAMYPEEQVRIRERDDSPVLTGKRSDYALALTAWEAKVRGQPYDPRDELVPLVDENGNVAAYDTRGVNRLITVAEASDPAFDICRLRDAQFESDVTRVADDESLPPEVRAQRPRGSC